MMKVFMVTFLISFKCYAMAFASYGDQCIEYNNPHCINGKLYPTQMLTPPRFINEYECIECQTSTYSGLPEYLQLAYLNRGAQFPSWKTFAQTNYTNGLNYPGIMGPRNWGMSSNHYAHHGGGGTAGKPNIYFSTNKDIDLKLKIDFKDKSGLISATPVHGVKGWSGKLSKKGILKVNNVNYSFLYYDYELNVKKLQNSKGFCTTKKMAVSEMVKKLYTIGFKDSEIKDFTDYWTYKLPGSKELCIFPQVNKSLDQVAHLNLTPAPTFFTRVTFMVIPAWAIDKKLTHHFTKRPSVVWEPLTSISRNVASLDYKLEVREWGVAFLNE